MTLLFRYLAISLTFIILLRHTAHALNKDYCRCKFLVRRSAVSYGKCGAGALCYWNLFYYADKFKSNDVKLASRVAQYEAEFKACAARIPIDPTAEPDPVCTEKEISCQAETETIFKDQCTKLYSNKTGNPEVLPIPPKVNQDALDRFRGKINRTYVPPPKFDGKSTYFFPRTCPSHHRRYQFTYYLLFDAATKKYKVAAPWNEEMGFVQVAMYMSWESLRESAENLESSMKKFGYDESNINPRRFCKHSDVFVCVDEHKGPNCIQEYYFTDKNGTLVYGCNQN